MRGLAIFLVALGAAAQDRTLTSEGDIRSIAFSKDGATVYAICADNKLRQWDARTGAVKGATAFAADERPMGWNGGVLALGVKDGVAIADVATGSKARQIATGGRRFVQMAVAPDGQAVAGSSRVEGNSRDEVMRLWDASGKERFAAAAGIGGASAMAISPDGSLLAAGSWDTNVRVWSTKNGELVKLIDELPVAVFGIAFTPDGASLAAAGVDRTVYVWNTKSWKLDRKLTGQPEMISSLAFSADGRSLATGGFNDITMKHPVSVLVWDFASGKVRKTVAAPHRVTAVALSPDGKTLAAAGGDKVVRVWEVK
jgi:WD40 repeat protein